MLSTGVTTVVDWSHAFNPDFARGNVQALLDSGLRFAFVYRGRVERVEDIRALKRAMIDPNPRASLQIGGAQPTMAEEVRLRTPCAWPREYPLAANSALLVPDTPRRYSGVQAARAG